MTFRCSKINPHMKPLMYDELRHFSGELAVPFAGDLRPNFQNSQPLIFFKKSFLDLLGFFWF